MPGYGDDVAVLAYALAKGSTQRRDSLVEIVVFNGRIRPESLHQLFFFCKHDRCSAPGAIACRTALV